VSMAAQSGCEAWEFPSKDAFCSISSCPPLVAVQVASQASPAPTGPGPAPGEPLSLGQKVLNTATSVLQGFKPLNKVCQHVCAFHCYAHDTTRQVGPS